MFFGMHKLIVHRRYVYLYTFIKIYLVQLYEYFFCSECTENGILQQKKDLLNLKIGEQE